jgi:hypothetical protein
MYDYSIEDAAEAAVADKLATLREAKREADDALFLDRMAKADALGILIHQAKPDQALLQAAIDAADALTRYRLGL